MKLTVTRSAQLDLVRLREFIAEHDPSAATRASQRLIRSIQKITSSPDSGVNVEGLPGVQDRISGKYIVRYLVKNDVVYVLRVWHSKEDR